MEKPIPKTCLINLPLYFLGFFLPQIRSWNSHLESSLEKYQRYVYKREPSESHQNPFSITATSLLHIDWYCQKTLKRTVDRWIQITSKPNQSDRLPSSTCQLCNKTVLINSKRLICIHCRISSYPPHQKLPVKLINWYVKIVISKSFLSQDYVNFKRLL